jgi:UDP-N-acetylmuramoyl-tripeptide--D-alanyl-D-alanine ligase
MGEVGEQGPAFHQEVLQKASQAGIEEIWLLGEAMSGAGQALGIGRVFADLPSLLAALRDQFQKVALETQSLIGMQQPGPGLTAWVKGSRFMRLERLVDGLLNLDAKGLACSS